MNDIIFEKFPRIPRLKRTICITEKLDGTNAQIYVGPDGEFAVGSRNRWITPEEDNYGFAAWAYEHKDALIEFLGEGRHFGEWWGQGIQRRYDLDEKRFSLFNIHRWGPGRQELPDFLHVVPTLYIGEDFDGSINKVMDELACNGSAAAPEFMNPEGIVVYHTAGKNYYKYTFEHDATGKPE